MARFKPYVVRWKRPIPIQEKRIEIPPILKRPVRFQTRTLIRQEYVRKDPVWAITHRRGINRVTVGTKPLEMRAVPHTQVRGTLPERIIYKYLVVNMRFVAGIDFSFQSSLQGGRMDKGGILADFDFPLLKIILNPLGPTHYEHIRIRKDNEQNMVLGEMGYTVYMIDEKDIYDEMRFEDIMRGIFNYKASAGGDMGTETMLFPATPNFGYAYLTQSIIEFDGQIMAALV